MAFLPAFCNLNLEIQGQGKAVNYAGSSPCCCCNSVLVDSAAFWLCRKGAWHRQFRQQLCHNSPCGESDAFCLPFAVPGSSLLALQEFRQEGDAVLPPAYR